MQGQGKFYEKNEVKYFKRCKKGGGDTTNSSNETTSPNNNSSNETTSVTNTATRKSNNAYVYGVGILAVLAIGFVYFLHITVSSLKLKKLSMTNRINLFQRLHVFKNIVKKTLKNLLMMDPP